MKRERLAYIAGILDADGCICVQRGPQNIDSLPCYSLRITVSNKSTALMNLLKQDFGGSVCKKVRKSRNHNWTYDWVLTGKAAIEALRILSPYLLIKREQAELAMTFPYPAHSNGGLSIEVREERKQLYNKIHKLNFGDRVVQHIKENK